MEFWRKRRVDTDPAKLSIDQLILLKAALTAKLLLVGQQLVCRYEGVIALSTDLPDQNSRTVLKDSADGLRVFNLRLEQELVSSLKPPRN
jgi:hypothetical protein